MNDYDANDVLIVFGVVVALVLVGGVGEWLWSRFTRRRR